MNIQKGREAFRFDAWPDADLWGEQPARYKTW
jgi:hypothetical protein